MICTASSHCPLNSSRAAARLVAVAQALHWFDRYRFFATCERVLRPGGVLAAWTYQDIIFEDDLAEVAEKVRDDIDPYWPPERADVDMGYGDYVWPFEFVPTPRLWLTAEWNLPTLLGYFGYFFGPPALGFLAGAFGLRFAFVFAATMLMAVLILAPLLARQRSAQSY